MKSRKGRKQDDAANARDPSVAEDAGSFLAGDVVDEYATDAPGNEALDRRGLLKRGALLAGLAGLVASDAKGQPSQRRKTMKHRPPQEWSLWWMKFKWKKSKRGQTWESATPANACTPACVFTPAEPCTALCQTPGDACTQSCIMVTQPPPPDPAAPVSPADTCTPGCVTEGTMDVCTPGCVTEGTMDICTPGCAE